jgi:hypothetical protein
MLNEPVPSDSNSDFPAHINTKQTVLSFGSHLCIYIPRPRVCEDEILDALKRSIEYVFVEFAGHNALRSHFRALIALETRRPAGRLFPWTHYIFPHSRRFRILGRLAARRHIWVEFNFRERVLQRLEDFVFDVDWRFRSEGVDEREVDEGRVVEHLPALRGGDGLFEEPLLLEVAHFAQEDCVFGGEFTGGGPGDEGLDTVLDAEFKSLHGSFGF